MQQQQTMVIYIRYGKHLRNKAHGYISFGNKWYKTYLTWSCSMDRYEYTANGDIVVEGKEIICEIFSGIFKTKCGGEKYIDD